MSRAVNLDRVTVRGVPRHRKICVGIDIGASGVKLCQLKRKKDEFILEHYGHVPLPPATIVDGAMMNPARIVDAIKELVSDPTEFETKGRFFRLCTQ